MALHFERQLSWLSGMLGFAHFDSSSSLSKDNGPHTTDLVKRQRIEQFEAFYWQYERQICVYLRRMLTDEQAVYDLSQEVFLRAWNHFETLHHHTTARAWLYRVATNLALTALHQRWKRPQMPLSDDLPGHSDPGRRIVENDLINRALEKLTPKQRSALLLFEVNGLSCEEIGHILGMSREAIRGTLFRARETFRLHYLREGEM